MSPTEQLLPHAIAPQPTPSSGLSRLYHSSFVRIGKAHLRDGRNCQDYAVTADCDHGTVLIVADGASSYYDEDGTRAPSFNEAAAILVGELARATALEGLRAGAKPDAIRDIVARQLHHVLRPVWQALGEARGKRILGCTLLLALITECYTRIYVSGDGAWGVFLPGGAGIDSVDGPSLLVRERDEVIAVRGSRHTPELGRIVSTAARLTPDAVIQALPLALAVDGPVLGAWISTDGLRDEPALERIVHSRPPHSSSVLQAALQRPEHSDDLALAWASDRLASILLATTSPAKPNGLASGGPDA